MSRRVSVSLIVCLGIILLSAGASYGQEAGAIVGWGSSVIVEQWKLEDLVAIAGGANHSLGLRSDGTVVIWGANYKSESSAPSPSDMVRIMVCGCEASGKQINEGYPNENISKKSSHL